MTHRKQKTQEKPPGNLEGETKEDELEKNKPNGNTQKEEPTTKKPKEEIPEETASPKQETEKPKQGNERHHEVLKCADLNVSNGELRSLSSNRSCNAYDLVDPMPFFICLSRQDQASKTGNCVKTKNETESKDWDQVFAFDKEDLNSTNLQ
ncbi:hypothetical protein V8G54_028155 [Vigna mungo]|uniref:C2 domain-containing protein n=1 Tax=Vigna mungo TaxID=3915 RepID=A0AAQ3MSG6_VIGMU